MEVEEVFFLRAEDGKFVRFLALENGLARLRQLGLASSRSNRSRGADPV